MLDDIKDNVMELNAISMMLMDELSNAYQIDDRTRLFEFDRIEDVLITSVSMIIARIDSIDGLVDKLDANNAGGQS